MAEKKKQDNIDRLIAATMAGDKAKVDAAIANLSMSDVDEVQSRFNSLSADNKRALKTSIEANPNLVPGFARGLVNTALAGVKAGPVPKANIPANVPIPRPRPDKSVAAVGTLQGYKSRVYAANAGAVRSRPIADKLRTVLDAAANAANVTVRVISGGQPARGTAGQRRGSTRHDLGNAADIQLIHGGRVLDFSVPAHRAIFETFVSTAAANGATGIGAGLGYMGPQTIHVGFGNKAVWGAGGKSRNAPEWLVGAVNAGWSNPAAFTVTTKPDEVTVGRQTPTEKLSTASRKVIQNKALIRKSSKGEHVKEVQRFLNEQGYTDRKGRALKVDGEVGVRTREAIKSYQADRGLKVDGVVGRRTMTTMLREVSPITPDSSGVVAARSVSGDIPAISPDVATIAPIRDDVLASLVPADISVTSPVVAAAANIGIGMADRFSSAFGPAPIGFDRAAYVRDFDVRQQAAMTIGGPLRTKAAEAGIALTGNSPLAGGDVGVTSYDMDMLDTIAAETAIYEQHLPSGGSSNLGGGWVPSYIEEREALYGASSAFARRQRQLGETAGMRRRFDDAFAPVVNGNFWQPPTIAQAQTGGDAAGSTSIYGNLPTIYPSTGNQYWQPLQPTGNWTTVRPVGGSPAQSSSGGWTPARQVTQTQPARQVTETRTITPSGGWTTVRPTSSPRTDAAGRVLGGI